MDTGNNQNIPSSYRKGEEFEEYVREYIFTKGHFLIIERIHNYLANKNDFIESSKNPDFKLRDKTNQREFYVEAKFRSYTDGLICWCNDNQLERYQEFNKKDPVIIILGLGNKPANPSLLYLFSLSEKVKSKVFPLNIEKFRIIAGQPVLSENLWSYLKQFS